MQPSNQFNKRNTIILIVICTIIILGLIIFGIVRAIIRSHQVEIGIYYAPFTAQVKLNDETIKNNSTIWIDPGEYHITVSLDHFTTLNTTSTVDQSTTNLYGSLSPSDEEGQRIMETYRADYDIIQSLNSAAAIALGEAQRAKWPLISALPISNPLFSIGYNISTNDRLTININAATTYLDDAIHTLKSHLTTNDSLANYNIAFNDWTNPLTDQFRSNTSQDPIEYLIQGYRHLNPDLNLVIQSGNYANNGQYYYTTITTGFDERYSIVTYRAILKKDGTSWQPTSTPQPIVTTYNTPEVSTDILNAANNL